jgi:aspartate racemase
VRTAGIIGGVGPESTIDYYRSIVAAYRERRGDGSYPSIIINSIDLNRLMQWWHAGEHPPVIEYLSTEVQKLARAGADFGLLAANTPHIVFNEVQQQSPIPLISIVQVTCDAAMAMGFKKLGIFGTRFTMQGRFYPDVLDQAGIELALPAAAEMDYIHDIYVNQLLKGQFLSETKARLRAIAERMRTEQGIQGLILAGTELPLLLRDVGECGVVFLDTTQIHVRAIVERLLESD